jgi:hypothetical protein
VELLHGGVCGAVPNTPLILNACAAIFDVIENLKNFVKFFETKQGHR